MLPGDNAAIMKILNMLEIQLNVKSSALEEEASKRRDAELEGIIFCIYLFYYTICCSK